MKKSLLILAASLASVAAQADISLIAVGRFSETSDLSGLTGTLESGVAQNIFGGSGSALAWAGGSTFLALPDRGPNAADWGGSSLDQTTSFLTRFHTVNLALTATPEGGRPYTLAPTLTGTTLFSSATALNYGASTAGYDSSAPTSGTNYAAGDAVNTDARAATGFATNHFFSGRSDNFLAGSNSTNIGNARFDPEAIRISNDGAKVYVSDEYGPYVYQFDRATGVRTNTYSLPSEFTAANLSSQGAVEISGNTVGRVANKGMEGLAITPDGKHLVGFEQSPLMQDGGGSGRMNRIVKIDTATGAVTQFAYDNFLADTNKNYNSSEILALNDNQFLVLERDGKGLGDASAAVVKRVYLVDLTNATEITGLTGESALLAAAAPKTLFLDIKAQLMAGGFAATDIPAKIEGLAFGEDIVDGGVLKHTLYVTNDNDFLPGTGGADQVFVFAFSDADLEAISPGATFQNQPFAAVPEPGAYGLLGAAGLAAGAFIRRRRRAR